MTCRVNSRRTAWMSSKLPPVAANEPANRPAISGRDGPEQGSQTSLHAAEIGSGENDARRGREEALWDNARTAAQAARRRGLQRVWTVLRPPALCPGDRVPRCARGAVLGHGIRQWAVLVRVGTTPELVSWHAGIWRQTHPSDGPRCTRHRRRLRHGRVSPDCILFLPATGSCRAVVDPDQ